jgi:hypothetical protein
VTLPNPDHRIDPKGDEFRALASAYLDGTLDEAARERLDAVVAADPAAARELARLSLLHEAIDRELTSGVVGRLDARAGRRALSPGPARGTAPRRRLVAAAALLVALGLAWAFVETGREASASSTLARIVEALRSGDRTYVLRAIEGDGRMRRREAPSATTERTKDRRPPAPIDGAVVSLRNPSSYVLVRRDAEGREVVSGSDGVTAWIVPVEGPVRVSGDPQRFRGALPGGRLDIPFIDPHADLSTLARNYDLIVQKPAPAAGRPDARIVATRRADARGGPKEIEIDFDAKSALVRAIRLVNLPQAQGGPRAIEFELIDDAPLSPDFFEHEYHHAKDRAVIEER